MLSGMQIRSARAALRWSMNDLSAKSGVGVQTIVRLESAEDAPTGRAKSHSDIQKAFETAGIEFIGSPGHQPGIRLK